MRYSILIFFFILLSNLSSCKTTQKVNEEKTLLKIDSLKNTSNKLYLLKNKKLDIVSLNGSLSYEKKDNEKTNVIQFVYERDMDQAAYDGGYKEEVIYEIPNDISEQNYSDAELQNTKMLFGRYCYCRGKTGLY
jgi:hypothetical protein